MIQLLPLREESVKKIFPPLVWPPPPVRTVPAGQATEARPFPPGATETFAPANLGVSAVFGVWSPCVDAVATPPAKSAPETTSAVPTPPARPSFTGLDARIR